MTKKTGVLVAMSGGVDSSVAAGLLQQQGYEVTGVFMCLGQAEKTDTAHPGCCSPLDARDAKEVAGQLGIRFHVLDFQEDLQKIIEYFVDEYRNARTPNPCIICNTRLKFGKLLEYADLIDAQYIATGHYARTQKVNDHQQLYRGVDISKDQSYALFGMGYDNLQRVMFPVGDYPKAQVRQLARDMNLPVHDKGESQEICFVPDDNYGRLIAQRAPELCKTGQVIHADGRILGEHQGIFNYTIGQRRGLGIALGEPAYVVKLDAQTNSVILGSKTDLLQKKLYADRVMWLTDSPPEEPFDAIVQIRYNHRGAPAKVTPILDQNGTFTEVTVDFNSPIPAITPGQAVVFYHDQMVLGGGWISKAEDE